MRFPRVRRALRIAVALSAVVFALLCHTWITLPDVRPLARTPPASTAFMRLRESQAAAEGGTARRRQRWVSYNAISPHLKRAVIVAEDAAFFSHEGLDFDEIKASMEKNWEEGEFTRGASTITQQLAKNLYLSPSRNPYRKVQELFIARRLEAVLTKQRIFELYLNLIEWGDGIWGAEAAARAYFGISAADLDPTQSALLAGAIINPRVYSPARPNARLLNRQQIILGRMRTPATTPAPETPTAPVAVTTPVSLTTPVTLTVELAGTGNGTVTSNPAGLAACSGAAQTCIGTFESGTVVTLTAVADSGHEFTGWSGACEGVTAQCTVTMSGAQHVAANFRLVPPR
jgi:monofunctional biosynthetic peptidoglycan transglycosylase